MKFTSFTTMWILSKFVFSVDAYFTGPLGLTWEQALDWCESQGSTLASISTTAEMADAVTECGAAGDPQGCHIGLSRITSEGVHDGILKWTDGSDTSFVEAWTLKDIDHAGGEHCTLLWTTWTPGTGRVEDIACDQTSGFTGSTYRYNPPLCNDEAEPEPELIVVAPEPLTCAEAQRYCKETYGTQLATIITDDDRADAIAALNAAGEAYGFIGLYSDPVETKWRFRSGDDCPSTSAYKCVDFWLSNPGGEQFRPRCIGSVDEGGSECAVFYADSNRVDNDVPADAPSKFLCDTDTVAE